jgi:hypothetical protein
MAHASPIPLTATPTPGTRVAHPSFGHGTVLHSSLAHIEIRFDRFGSLSLPRARHSLSPADSPAPRLVPTKTLNEIRAAVQFEIRAGARPTECQIESITRDGPLFRVQVNPESLLDATEGARAWWPDPNKGSAEVASLLPLEGTLWLRRPTTTPPSAGRPIYLYPPEFLQKLAELWQDNDWAVDALSWHDDIERGRNPAAGQPLDPRGFTWLRAAQRQAFDLPRFRFSRLHGPPGTGKTTTLGALLAQFLTQKPGARVLLLANTNAAVDLALLSADSRLPGGPNRPLCQRIGLNFSSSAYTSRPYLLPPRCEALLHSLNQLEADPAAPADAHAYVAWKDSLGKLRAKLRARMLAALRKARLAAMTLARALMGIEDLRELAPYDLIVFDEASQISLAHALALLPLARHALFAGDPHQLAPIYRSATGSIGQRWLGRTAFDLAPHNDSTVFLDEQSRMAPAICHTVSQTFYQGRLRVADDALQNPHWLQQRSPAQAQLVPVHGQALWSPLYRGLTRQHSAQRILELLPSLLHNTPPQDIAIVTPYRAQRALLQHLLRQHGLPNILVSTAHSLQGSERHTVLFDPVDGAGRFLSLPAIGDRLINVALSRAQAHLLVFLSPTDRRNPTLNSIASRLTSAIL